MIVPCFAALLAALRARRGVAAAEFALIAVPMVMLLIATYNIGIVVYERTLLAQAVRAGAQYALSFPTQTDSAVSAVKAALPTGLQSTAQATVVACHCTAGGTCASVSSGDLACDAVCGSLNDTYVHLCASLPAPALLDNDFLATLAAPSAKFVIRVQ